MTSWLLVWCLAWVAVPGSACKGALSLTQCTLVRHSAMGEGGMAFLFLVVACLVVLASLAEPWISRTHAWGHTWEECSGVLPEEILTSLTVKRVVLR